MEHPIPSGILTLGIIGVSGTTTQAFSLALTRGATMVKISSDATLSKVKMFVSAVSGTVGATDMVLDVFSNVGATFVPNASLASSSTVTASPTGAAWVEWTGFSLAMTKNTVYWLVVRNAAAVPATNNFTLRTVNGFPTEPITGLGGGAVLARKTSADGGTTWSAFAVGGASVRMEFSGSVFWGIPYENTATSAVGVGVYNTRELGNKFTIPVGVNLRIMGAVCPQLTSTGSPTGFPRIRLYNGTTLMATSNVFNQLSANGTLTYFDSPQDLLSGQTYRLVVGESTQSDASTNRFNIVAVITIENNADSAALMPFSAVQTYFDGSTWADTSTSVVSLSMVLATGQESPPSPLYFVLE